MQDPRVIIVNKPLEVVVQGSLGDRLTRQTLEGGSELPSRELCLAQ